MLGRPGDARRRRGARLPVLVPEELGRARRRLLRRPSRDGPRVDFVYRARPGLPSSQQDRRGHADHRVPRRRHAGDREVGRAGAKVERLTVGGDPAFFISGAPHGFAYYDPDTVRSTSRSSAWPATRCSSTAPTACCCASRPTSRATRAVRDRRVDALERLAAGEAGLDAVPVRRPTARRAASTGRPPRRRSGRGSRPARARGRAPRGRASRASRSRARSRPTRGRARGPARRRRWPRRAGRASLSSRRSASRRAGVAHPAHGGADDREQPVGLLGCPVAVVQHPSRTGYYPVTGGARRHESDTG